MKQLFLFAGAMALAGGMLFTSCKDNTEEQPGTVPEVSISADETFASDYTATLTLTLSSASSSDVVVKLADADVESGQSEVPAVYSKSVTIGAGKTSATVKVSADVLGLTEGTYQSAIMIASAEGADVAENSVVYIGLDYVELPAVNLYADDHFTHTRTAELRLRLEEAAEANVTVTLEDDASSTVSVEYEKTVSIPAGETEAAVPVTVVIPDDMAQGNYKAVINIASVENAVSGNSRSVTISLSYPFEVEMTMDGLFDDWDTPEVTSYPLPEGDVKYPVLRTLKLAANSKDVYMYFELQAPEDFGYTAFDANTMPFNVIIDHDGNAATGAYIGTIDNATAGQPFDPMGLTYYIEGALRDGSGDPFSVFYSMTVYRADCVKDGGFFWSSDVTLTSLVGKYDGETIYGVGSYEDGIGRIEVKFDRNFFGMTGTAARFAIKVMDSARNWDAIGLLPQGNTENGEFKPVDMAVINLPAYVE